MELTATAIAEYLNGTIEGDPNAVVTEIAKIDEGCPGGISFLSNPKYEHHLYSTASSIVLVNRALTLKKPVKTTLIRVDDAYGALAKLLMLVDSQRDRKQGIHPTACIEPGAIIGQQAYIGAYAYIGKDAIIEDRAQIYPHVYIGDSARIGEASIIYPGVCVYHACEIGPRCIIHAGAVIGADGFGFAPQADGSYTKIPQLGNVIIDQDVEIGANTTIDRAAMGATRVHHGVKLDNLIQIAHNVSVGAHTVIAAQSGIAGSTKVGEKCMFGGQVGLVGHIEIANEVKLGAQAGVSNSIRESGKAFQGTPAMPLRQFYKTSALIRQLADLERDIAELKRRIDPSEQSDD